MKEKEILAQQPEQLSSVNSNKSDFEAPKSAAETRAFEAEIPRGELINLLKPHPTLLSIVLDTMTDEEFERYVDSLPDEPEDMMERGRTATGPSSSAVPLVPHSVPSESPVLPPHTRNSPER